MRVAVIGAAAISAFGRGWRGLGEALEDGRALAGTPDEVALANPRARKMMSRGAYLAASCLGDLLRDATWPRAGCGYFLGVGASGGSLADVTALFRESLDGGAFSLARFGDRGLAACNPLLAFQLMNNFTLCHGAILEGVGGPNSALFSRGAGTVAALSEAAHAVADGTCEHAIAGGADSALHPVTRGELVREGFLGRGLHPAEGVALVALGALGGATTGAAPIGVVEGVAIASGLDRPLPDAIHEAVARAIDEAAPREPLAAIDVVVASSWGPPRSAELRAWLRGHASRARVIETSAILGDALAARPALAWVAALDLLVAGRARRVLALDAGTDGDVGAVVISRGAA